MHNGVRFRSRTEARWSIFFDIAGIPWRYESEAFQFGNEVYIPDFLLPREDAFLEIKGVMPDDDCIGKMARFSEASGKRLYVAIGSPEIGPRVADVQRLLDPGCDGSRDCLFALTKEDHMGWLAPDRRRDDIIWLTRTEAPNFDCHYGWYTLVTKNDAADNDKWPFSSSRFDRAYEAAQKHRFDWR